LKVKIANKEQKRDIAEGDIFKDIQEVWVATISGTTLMHRALSFMIKC
jgi:hypothetical protein